MRFSLKVINEFKNITEDEKIYIYYEILKVVKRQWKEKQTTEKKQSTQDNH